MDEAARLDAVTRYDILDTPPDGAFDRIASLAARWFGTPLATVSIVDTDRIWFKATYGLEGVRQIDRFPGLCASAILQDDPYLITDASVDVRTLDNPAVHGPMGIRFYAAAPLVTADGYRLGTVNVLDTVPRQAGADDLQVLSDLAAVVMDELELRLSALDTLRQEREQRRSVEMLATTLQTTLLPPSLPEIPGLTVASYYRAASADQVGGDFYDLFALGPDRWAFFLGDVQGHGADAAVVTSLVRYTLRAAALHHPEPADCLAELNRTMCLDDRVERFCTLVFGIITPDPGGAGHRVTMSTGGHPPAILVRPADREVTQVRPETGMLVGVLPEARFGDCTVHLRPGQTLLLHTDGLTEARDPGTGAILGEPAVLASLRAALHTDAPAAVGVLRGFLEARTMCDDVALLAFTPTR